jgi:hypothetical protein
MADYMRALKWPVLTWIVLDALYYVADKIYAPAGQLFTPDVAAITAVIFGIWGGSKIVEFKGKYWDALGAGVVLGVLCFGLCIVTGFGAQLGVYMGLMNLSGALIGGGYALTR